MTISFFICRYMFKDFTNNTVKNIAYLRAIFNLIQSNESGYKIVFLSRLMPLPFGLANALFAVTDVDFFIYILASVIGLVPSQLILCYMGSTLKSMSDVLANEKTGTKIL
jgi:protein maelstrom